MYIPEKNNSIKSFFKHCASVIFLVAVFFLASVDKNVLAASIVVSPNAGNYNVGDLFTLSVYATSPDEYFNALSGRINFPADKLTIVSVSKVSTVVNFWTIDPGEYINEVGVIRFEGVVLNPGYKGNRGNIFSVTFRVKTQGTAAFNFLSASVLANDGKGTNILSSVRDGLYVLGPVGSEFTTEELGDGLPLAPQVISSTHPNGFEWYSQNKASFAWNLAPDTTAVAYVVDKKPTTNPGASSKGMMSMYTTDVLEDGTWYLHVRTRNQKGWGSITHFRFQIDTTPPSRLVIIEMDKTSKTSPRGRFMFESEDEGSGIKEYDIEIGTTYGTTWFENSSNIYETPPLPPGAYDIIVTAKDRAGNNLKQKAPFTIIGLPAPIIKEYTGSLNEGEPIVIKGTTLPGFEVILSLFVEGKGKLGDSLFYNSKDKEDVVFETTTQARADGTFTIVLSERFRSGSYIISAKAANKDGATSENSEPVVVIIRSHGFFAGIFEGKFVVPIAILIVFLVFLFIFIWYRMRLMKYKISHEIRDTEQLVARSFDILAEDADTLNKINLHGMSDSRDKMLILQHQKDIEDAEKVISSRMNSMKRGLDALNEK